MTRRLGRALLRLGGWEIVGAPPARARYVLIAAPHTSNWDLYWMLAYGLACGVRPRWMGKHTLFRGPLARFWRALGGIPIRRHRREGVVDAMARAFAERDELVLAVPPEATRSHRPHWRSGFYHIARAAKVPIVLGFLDFGTRRGGFGPAIEATGDVARDMDAIRAFYADKRGKHPHRAGPVRLVEEDL